MTSTRSSDPARKSTEYYPWWLDNFADDVTGEGAAIEGTLHGAEEVRKLVLDARELYEQHEFQFTGDYGDKGFILSDPRRTHQRYRHGYPQRRRGGPAPRGEPPTTQLCAALCPRDGREVRGYASCQVLHHQRVLKEVVSRPTGSSGDVLQK